MKILIFQNMRNDLEFKNDFVPTHKCDLGLQVELDQVRLWSHVSKSSRAET